MNTYQVPSLFEEGATVTIKWGCEDIGKDLSDNLGTPEEDPKQLRLAFNDEDKMHNAQAQSTNEEFIEISDKLSQTLAFVNHYGKKNLSEVMDILTLSEGEKKNIISICDEALTCLEPIAIQIQGLPKTLEMYTEVTSRIKKIKVTLEDKNLEKINSNCDYIGNARDKDFYSKEQEERVDTFLENVQKSRESSNNRGAKNIESAYIDMIKSLTVLNYQIHKKVNPYPNKATDDLSKLLGINGENNSQRDNKTANLAHNIISTENDFSDKNLQELWERFMYLEYELTTRQETSKETEQPSNAQRYFQNNGKIDITPKILITTQKKFVKDELARIKKEAYDDGYQINYYGEDGRYTVVKKTGFKNALISLARVKQKTEDEYNDDVSKLEKRHNHLLKCAKTLEDLRKELGDRDTVMQTASKIPAFRGLTA